MAALWEHHCPRDRFLVGSQSVRDLLFCAKDLFFAARPAWALAAVIVW
jgi:hypothetical protein